MSLRIVLYAEGPGDAAGEVSRLPAPTELLDDVHLGPAHALLRRCITREQPMPDAAVNFLCPLRTSTGRHHKGSDLVAHQTLRQLLTWPLAKRRPDLAVVFVDADGQKDRPSSLREFVDGIPLPHVIAVPVQEFETWLIADHRAVAGVLSPAPNQPPAVESLAPRGAKTLLDQWTSAATHNPDPAGVRSTLAQTCDLAVLDRLSAFQRFRDDLRTKLSAL